jgi:hypothetical protein
MDKLRIYEFVGLICPGALTIYGLSFINPGFSHTFPQVRMLTGVHKLSLGDFGLLLLLAFVAGHLVQTLGNVIENYYWLFWRGKPHDWLRSGAHYLISPQQTAKMPLTIKKVLKVDCPEDLRTLSRRDWLSFTRQIYAAVKKSGQAGSVDIFTGAYDLLRGIAVTTVILTVAGFVEVANVYTANVSLNVPLTVLSLGLCFTVSLAVAIYRMHWFGVRYARELFLQFLTIDLDAKDKPEIAD